MKRIAAPQDLQAELLSLRAFIHHSEKPDREVIASKLHDLAFRVNGRAQDLSKLPGFDALEGLSPEQQRQVIQKAQRAVQKDLEKGRKELEQSAKGLWKAISEGQ